MQRRIKRIDSYFTLENQERAEKADILCDQCGDDFCPIRMVLVKLKINRKNAKLGVTRCGSFMPQLVFRDSSGMESEFNTFRLGAAWSSRLRAGDTVALTQHDGIRIGTAEVTSVTTGLFTEMEREYGIDNHLAIDSLVSGEEFDLAKIMRDCYGGHRFNTNSVVTVIELRRNDKEEL